MTYESTPEICYPKWPDIYAKGRNLMFLTYVTALIVVGYVLPLVVMAFTYVNIKRQVRDSVVLRKSMRANGNGDEVVFLQSLSNRKRREKEIWRQSKKAGSILTPLVILFAVTMFPLNALRVLALILPRYWMKAYYNLIMGQVIMFVMINSSANPLVYYMTSKEFKNAFKNLQEFGQDELF